MIIALSTRITEEIDMYILGLIGMKVDECMVASILNDNNLQMAMMMLLERFTSCYGDKCAAYNDLCTALKHKEVKLAYLIKEVLEVTKTRTGDGSEGRGVNKYTSIVFNSEHR